MSPRVFYLDISPCVVVLDLQKNLMELRWTHYLPCLLSIDIEDIPYTRVTRQNLVQIDIKNVSLIFAILM